MRNIAVVDLGIANVFNVVKAVGGYAVKKPAQLSHAEKIIIPGVGNFSAIMEKLDEFREVITEKIENSTPLLGICLGFQVLFESSEECGNTAKNYGLGIIKGRVKKFKGIRVPHMGWNQIELSGKTALFDGLKTGDYFYFVHSYYVETEETNLISTFTEYGERENGNSYRFASSASKGNVFGVQFHPEKSGENGKKLLENFMRIEASDL